MIRIKDHLIVYYDHGMQKTVERLSSYLEKQVSNMDRYFLGGDFLESTE